MNPAPCDDYIFKNGKSVAALDARSIAAESWVQAVAKQANAKMDWHYSGGVANVLYVGTLGDRMRIELAIDELAGSLEGTILMRYNDRDPGLHRAGVTQAPEGSVMTFMDMNTGQAAYLKKPENKSK